MRQASNSVASRPPAIDLKLRLTLRVAALAGLCFIAVAAYALFDSDRVAKAKASRIAEDTEAQRELIAVQAEEAAKRPRSEKLKKEKPKEEKATRAAKGGGKK